MTTVPERTHESTAGAVSKKWAALLDQLEWVSPWLGPAASLLAYGVLYALLLVGAGVAAVSIGALVPGIAGGLSFFTVGLGLIAAAPLTARRLFIRAHDAIGDGVLTLDDNPLFRIVTQGMVELTGYSKPELSGMSLERSLVGETDEREPAEFIDLLGGDRYAVVDLEPVREVREKLGQSDRDVMRVECPIWTADDEVATCDVQFGVLPTGDEFVGTAGVFVDGSGQQVRKRHRREERDRTWASFENATDPIEEASIEEEPPAIEPVTPAFEEVFEYETTEVTDRTVPDILVPDETEDRSTHAEIVPIGEHDVINIGATEPGAFDESDVLLARLLAANTRAALDQPDREQAIRRRSAAMEAASDGIAILDETEAFVYANTAYADIHDYDGPEDLLGETWKCLYDEDEIHRFEREILPTVREQGHWRGEAVGVRADGTPFPQDVSLSALEDGGVVCVVRDVTGRKAYEEGLEALNAASQELTRAETADEVARTGLRAVERILGVDVGCVRLFDAEANSLEPVAMTDEAADLVASGPAFDLEATLAGRAYRQEEIVVDEGEVRSTEQASLHLPLGEHGVVTMVTRDAECFEEREIALAEALAASVRAALGRADREETLRSNQRELRQQHEQLDTQYRITTLVQEIGEHLIEATTREELERTICERVAASELYRSAWIGRVGVTGDIVDVHVGAGLDDAYLDALDELPVAMLGSGTVEQALETGEFQAVRQYQPTESDPETDADDVEERVEATAAIPLADGERIHGVLVVNGAREDVFSENALAGFESLGKLVGFAITALRTRELLLSDAVVELDLTVADPTLFYSSVTMELGCRCRFDRSVPIEDGRVLNYHLLEGAEPARVIDLAEEADQIEAAQVVSERGEEFVLQTITERSVSQLALEAGASLQSAVADHGEAQVTLEVPRQADIRAVIDTFEAAFERVDFDAKRERARAVQTAAEFREGLEDRLTEKQRAALEAAYAGGYFEWPREITAEELAESIGVSSSTLHQHLRKSEKTLIAAFFDEPQRVQASP